MGAVRISGRRVVMVGIVAAALGAGSLAGAVVSGADVLATNGVIHMDSGPVLADNGVIHVENGVLILAENGVIHMQNGVSVLADNGVIHMDGSAGLR
jgi:hypothetical protein